MKAKLEQFLTSWPSTMIVDRDIQCFLEGYPRKSQNDMIQRAVSWGWLIRIRRGLYVIGPPFRQMSISKFEVAQLIYGPSYISMQSALSFHGLIPEAVYATVSATANRTNEFETPIGSFLFYHVPTHDFFQSVERINNQGTIYLMASPLKALGDYVYTNKKDYQRISDLESDLRIGYEEIEKQSTVEIEMLAQNYLSRRVQKFFQMIKKELNV